MKRPLLLVVTAMLLARFASAQDIFDAVKKNDLAGATAVLEKDTSLVRAKDSSGNTPLHAAAISGSVPMADLLLSRGAGMSTKFLDDLRPKAEDGAKR